MNRLVVIVKITSILILYFISSHNASSIEKSIEETTESVYVEIPEANETILETVTLKGTDEAEIENNTRSESCKCGEAGEPFSIINLNVKLAKASVDLDPLIIGGDTAGEDEFPWMAVIAKKRLFEGIPKIICGGSVINSRFILTAAHCISSQFSTQLEIWLKAHNSSDVKNNKKLIKLKVRRLIPHPQWDPEVVANDIGLIELSTPILFSSQNLNPVCLPKVDHGDFAAQNGTVVGFGYTKPYGFMAKILQKLVVPILSHEECSKTKYGDVVASNPAFLCGGFPEGGKDACTNDSGGPLTVVKDGKHTLVGIVSWGHGCAQPLLPGVYTRVTKYINWIDSIVKPQTRCSSK